MLDLGTALEESLKTGSTTACYLLHLEYNSGGSTNTLYFSDRDRTVNGVEYLGLVQSWGSLRHEANLLNFSSSLGAAVITLDNGDHAVVDEQFTSLYANKNFDNRTWKLFLSDGDNVSTDTIGQGRISGEINTSSDVIQLYLTDNRSKYSVEVPSNKVNVTDHPFAPDINIGQPIPMSFGDFSLRTDLGTITDGFDKHKQFVKAGFPAIITDRDDIDATPDSVGIKELRTKNVFIYIDGLYASCDSSSSKVVVDASSPLITFYSAEWFTFFPFVKSDSGSGSGIVTDPENAVDLDFDTEAIMEVTFADDFVTTLAEKIPDTKKLGGFKDISVHLNFNNASSSLPKDATIELITSSQTDALAWPFGGSNLIQEVDVSNAFSTDQKSNWSFDVLGAVRELTQVKVVTGQTSGPLIIGVTYRITNYVAGDDFLNVGAPSNATNVEFTATGTTPTDYSNGSTLKAEVDVPIKEIGLEVQFAPPQQVVGKDSTVVRTAAGVTHTLVNDPWDPGSGAIRTYSWVDVPYPATKAIVVTNRLAPKGTNIIYFSGKGRTYGTWIDTVDGGPRATYTGVTDPGYTGNATAGSGDLNENPVYLVEQILRDEGGFDETNIDLASFDISGAASNGVIGDVFNDSVADIKFAFSQDSSMGLLALIQRIGTQCATLYFISGSGRVKAKTRKLPPQYSASDKDITIDYNDISDIKPTKTSVGEVSNNIIVRYEYDYGFDRTISRVDSTQNALLKDSTSQGNGVGGIDDVLTYDFEEDLTLDETTAVQYAKAQLAFRKDRHGVLRFTSNKPIHQKIEIGDLINLLNYPVNQKPFGAVITLDDIFMCSQVTKIGPSSTEFTVVRVSE